MFERKAGTYLCQAPFRCSTFGEVPGLTHKHWTRLERLARAKHSNLLRILVDYARKSLMLLATIKHYRLVIWGKWSKSISYNNCQAVTLVTDNTISYHRSAHYELLYNDIEQNCKDLQT
jgi:hypothetical protein